VDSRNLFLVLSLALRVLESLGATGAMIAAFSLTAVSFPESVASTFVRITRARARTHKTKSIHARPPLPLPNGNCVVIDNNPERPLPSLSAFERDGFAEKLYPDTTTTVSRTTTERDVGHGTKSCGARRIPFWFVRQHATNTRRRRENTEYVPFPGRSHPITRDETQVSSR